MAEVVGLTVVSTGLADVGFLVAEVGFFVVGLLVGFAVVAL